jgi:tetratricopeptide (TPR) repeat protein
VITRRLAILAALALTVAGIPMASADADADARAKAAAHFKQGQAFFQRADYDRALTEYQAAFELSEEPSLIFNIALCHDRAPRPDLALAAFRRYLELAPNGSVADEAREDVARLTPIVDRLIAERAAQDASRREREAAARHSTAAPLPAPPPARSHAPRYVMAAGAAVLAIGATAHVLAWRTRGRLTAAPDPDAYFTDRATFETERGLAIGAYAIGAATLATGLILERVLGSRSRVEISIAVAPDASTVAVAWSR